MRINRHSLILGILYCLPLLTPVAARAQEISVEYATSHVNNGTYLVDVRLKLRLNDEIINALHHGVSLNIDVNMEVRRERKWIWNKLIKKVILHFRIQNHQKYDWYIMNKRADLPRRARSDCENQIGFIVVNRAGDIRN